MAVSQFLVDNAKTTEASDRTTSRVGFFPNFPAHIDQVAVTNANAAYTIPDDTRYVIFGYKGDLAIAVRADATAVYPAAGKTDGSGSFINPAQCNVAGLTTLNFISDEAGPTYVTIAAYK